LIKLRRNAFTGKGTPHYFAHQVLEAFWEPYRKNQPQFGKLPTNAEYGKALERSLTAAGITPLQAKAFANKARVQRIAKGYNESDAVPRIPRRINQKK